MRARAAPSIAVAVAMALIGAPATATAQRATPAPVEAATPPPDGEATTERTVGRVLLGVAGAAVATGIAFGVVSVIEHRRSRDVLEQASEGEQLDPRARSAYADAIGSRDDFRVVSGVAAGTGLGLFLLAGALFALDEARDPPPAAAAMPVVGPGFAGATTTVRF